MRTLTTKQAAVVSLVRASWRRRGRGPYFSEIIRALGVTNQAVQKRVAACMRKGALSRPWHGRGLLREVGA